MTKKQYTSFYTDTHAIDYHRKLGNKCYGTDIDMLEFTYENGEPKFLAMIDYKHGNSQFVNLAAPTVQAQMKLANQIKVGFFICITYLNPEEFETPMYFLVPMNDQAKTSLAGYERTENGTWFTVKQYSKFQHDLRKVFWNRFEKDNDGQVLGDLSDEDVRYNLPRFNY